MNYGATSFLPTNWTSLIGLILIALIIFLIIREFLTWYWKINRIVELLERIEENTKAAKPQRVLTETEKREQTASELAKLEDLRYQGSISGEEFEAGKKKILS